MDREDLDQAGDGKNPQHLITSPITMIMMHSEFQVVDNSERHDIRPRGFRCPSASLSCPHRSVYRKKKIRALAAATT
jgi:hypothetical protein